MKRILFLLLLVSGFTKAQVGNSYLTTSTYNVLSYGAKGDSTTDNTAAFQRCINAIQASPSHRGSMYIPNGVYKVTSNIIIHFDEFVTIYGDGTGAYGSLGNYSGRTKIYTTSSTLDLFTDSSSSATTTSASSYYHDMELVCNATTPTGGAAINLVNSNIAHCSNMAIDNFFIGIWSQQGASNIYENLFILSPVQYGIWVENTSVADQGDAFISNCYFQSINRATVAAIYQTSSGGLKVINCKLNAGGSPFPVNGIKLAINGNTGDILISNTSVENWSGGSAITIASGSNLFHDVVLSGLQLANYSSHGTGITLSGAGGGSLLGISITGGTFYNQLSGDTAIKLITLSNASVSGVLFRGGWLTNLYQSGTSSVFYDKDPPPLTNNRIAFGSAASLMTNSANLKWDDAVDTLRVSAGANLLGGIRIDGTNNPAFIFERAGVTKSVFLQVTANGSGFTDALANDFVINSQANNVLIGSGGGASTLVLNSTLAALIKGGVAYPVSRVSATGTYSATGTDYTIQFTGSTATLVYPTVNLIDGRHLNLVNNASGSITIPSTKTGNASTTTTMTTGTRLQVEYDLTNTTWIQVN